MPEVQCPNCHAMTSDDEEAYGRVLLSNSGFCPTCGKDWTGYLEEQEAEADAALTLMLTGQQSTPDLQQVSIVSDGSDTRAEHIVKTNRMLLAYAEAVAVGSAATWIMAREVVAAAQDLVKAEEARAPRNPWPQEEEVAPRG